MQHWACVPCRAGATGADCCSAQLVGCETSEVRDWTSWRFDGNCVTLLSAVPQLSPVTKRSGPHLAVR